MNLSGAIREELWLPFVTAVLDGAYSNDPCHGAFLRQNRRPDMSLCVTPTGEKRYVRLHDGLFEKQVKFIFEWTPVVKWRDRPARLRARKNDKQKVANGMCV